MKNRPIIFGIIALGLSLCAASKAAVILNTNVWLGPAVQMGLPQYDYALTVYQDPDHSDPTSIFFNRQNDTLIYQARNLDGGSFWYLASYGDRFNASTVSQGEFIQFGPNSGDALPIGMTDFYFGVVVNDSFQPKTYFGWAHLRNSPSGLELLGSGVTYDSPEIFVGVPEPSGFLLLGISAAACAFSRRRARC